MCGDGRERLGECSWMRDLADQKDWTGATYCKLKKLLHFWWLLGSNVMHGQEGPLGLDWPTLRKDFSSDLMFTLVICLCANCFFFFLMYFYGGRFFSPLWQRLSICIWT